MTVNSPPIESDSSDQIRVLDTYLRRYDNGHVLMGNDDISYGMATNENVVLLNLHLYSKFRYG